jgi:hypothetical protein
MEVPGLSEKGTPMATEARSGTIGAGSSRIRSRAAAVCAAGYVVALTSFWFVGAVAYLTWGHGAAKLLGLLYFPILLLPVVGGRGMLGALHVHSSIWLWWFGLQMLLGVAAIWLYPHERSRRTRRLHASDAGAARPTHVR